jgi:ketosteroid isomerase-like protein
MCHSAARGPDVPTEEGLPKFLTLGASVLALAASAPASAGACVPAAPEALSPALADEIAGANAELAAAWRAGDARRIVALFAADSLIMPEHQQRLFGPAQGLEYYRALYSRMRVNGYAGETADILPLAGGALEWGTFELAYAPVTAGEGQRVGGKYMHLWRRQDDGTLKLKAQVWGFTRPLGEAASLWLVDAPRTPVYLPAGDPALGAELDALNEATVEAVRTYSTSRIDEYAPDAVYLPYADRPYVGIDAIRAHLVPYIEAGRGATFDSVRVWNDGYETIGGYVVEYSNFEVSWRAGDASGVTSGGGLRLLRREADCSLSLLRQAGIHHRP